jgi:hypothetical protein
MASKTTPNWSQRIEEKNSTSVVYTRKNTSLETWKQMVIQELRRHSVTNLELNQLAALHAWEGDATPYSYAYTLWQREVRAEDKRRNPMG